MEHDSTVIFEEARKLGGIVISNDTVRPISTLYGPDFWVENQTYGNDGVFTNEPFGGGQVVIRRGLNKEAELFFWECQVGPIIGESSREFLEDTIRKNTYSPSESRNMSQMIEHNMPLAVFGSMNEAVIVFLPNGKKMEVGDANIKIIDNSGHVTIPRSIGDADSPYEQIPVGIEMSELLGKLDVQSGAQIGVLLRLRREPQQEWKKKLRESIQDGSFTPDMVRRYVNLSLTVSDDSEFLYA